MDILEEEKSLEKLFWVGLTGGIATGKSTVAGFWRQMGVLIVDADQIVHQLLAPTGLAWPLVVSHFGKDLVRVDGTLDRALLGKRVFHEPKLLRELEAILHPLVQDEVRRQKTSAQDQGALLAVYDVPLLFENGMQDQFAAIVVVSCWPEQQLQRLQTRNSLTEQQAQERLAQQWPLQKKMTAAHFVIDNSTDLSATDLQAEAVLRQLQDLALKAKRK